MSVWGRKGNWSVCDVVCLRARHSSMCSLHLRGRPRSGNEKGDMVPSVGHTEKTVESTQWHCHCHLAVADTTFGKQLGFLPSTYGISSPEQPCPSLKTPICSLPWCGSPFSPQSWTQVPAPMTPQDPVLQPCLLSGPQTSSPGLIPQMMPWLFSSSISSSSWSHAWIDPESDSFLHSSLSPLLVSGPHKTSLLVGVWGHLGLLSQGISLPVPPDTEWGEPERCQCLPNVF